MQKPNVEAQPSEITYDRLVIEKIEGLSVDEQRKISSDLTVCYGRTVQNFFLMQVQSFWSEEQGHLLTMVSSGRFPISIGKHTLIVECDFCDVSCNMFWHVVELKEYTFENVFHMSDMSGSSA